MNCQSYAAFKQMSPSIFHPSPDEDERPQLSIEICAPYGYYELEIRIAGDNVDNQDNSQDIQWQIDAASNEVTCSMTSRFHDNAALYVG